MSIAMTQQQEKDFDEMGFIILDDFLSHDELTRLLSAVDEVAETLRESKGLGERTDLFGIVGQGKYCACGRCRDSNLKRD